ncbi:kinetochore Sim4 complex subunit FTA2-domain-containing protein [Fusarium oxysporum]|nr:kinetochore Sim4 complex subunit FTA2-domain-containing protein [Fusarium oxysporum]
MDNCGLGKNVGRGRWVAPHVPFSGRNRRFRIQWLERLDNKDADVTSSQGYVFRARIRSHEYAVKIFKFFDLMTEEYPLGRDTPLDTAAYYTDPIYAQCRAYGCIREAIKQRVPKADVAIPCHGFLFLRPYDQDALKMGVSSEGIRKILSRVISMNRAGIYNMDIRIDHFRDGKLVDFGSSWTEPHALLDSLKSSNQRAALESKIADRVTIEQMVNDEEIETRWKVKALHPIRLRSQTKQ